MTNQGNKHWFVRVLSFLLGASILVLAFVFSLVLLAILLAVAVVLLSYYWWKIRAIRKVVAQRAQSTGGDAEMASPEAGVRPVIEGEARRVDPSGD